MNHGVEQMFLMNFEKPAADVRKRVEAQVLRIKNKIEERQARVAKLRAEYSIDDAAMIDLLTQARRNEARGQQAGTYSYASNAPVKQGNSATEMVIGAGAVKNLMTEGDAIDREKDQVKHLELYARNVEDRPHYGITSYNGPESERPMKGVTLSREEIEFLGY